MHELGSFFHFSLCIVSYNAGLAGFSGLAVSGAASRRRHGVLQTATSSISTSTHWFRQGCVAVADDDTDIDRFVLLPLLKLQIFFFYPPPLANPLSL
jgi:hypothetical protein